MFTRIGRLVVRHPWKVIGAWLVAAALVVALSPTVDDIVNEDDKAFVPDSYESSKAAAAEAKRLRRQRTGRRSSSSSGPMAGSCERRTAARSQTPLSG